jgi:murein DD-endopeptidase MepM/ murein hydrolase activator NlpD
MSSWSSARSSAIPAAPSAKITILLAAALSCAFLFANMFPSQSQAQTVEEIRNQINNHNSAIKQLEAEIAQYQRELDVLGTERQTLQSSVRSLDVSRAKLGAEISATENKIAAAELQLDRLSFSIEEMEERISLNQESVAKSIRDLDKADDATLIEQLLASNSLTDAWIAADQIVALNGALKSRTASLSEARNQLAAEEAEVGSTRESLSSFNSQLSGQKQGLDANRQEKQSLLTQTKNKESEYQDIVAAKQAERASFESALFNLSSQLQYAADPSKIPPAAQGALRWPLSSVRITQSFGVTADSGRLYASGSHDGIDLAASVGTPVSAALAGTVMQVNQGAVPNCQYGKWVVIKHANGLATLYAHLSSINVSPGQSVSTGQAIGAAGMTGYATGPHLHFTVYSADAVTFKQYTCRSSGTVVTIPIAPPNGYLNPMSYL